MKKCPYCAEEIQDEAKFCRFCKHDLPRIKDSAQINQFRLLPFENETKIRKETISLSAELPRKQKGNVGLLLIICIVIGAVAVIYLKYSSTTGNSNHLPFPKDSLCNLRQEDQSFEISIQGPGVLSDCNAAIGKNNDFAFSDRIETVSPMCTYSIGNRTFSVHDIHESSVSQKTCSWLEIHKNFTDLSISDLLSSIVASEKIATPRPTLPFIHIPPNQKTTSTNNICNEWSQITLSDVGKSMCVYGIVRNSWFSEQQWAQIFIFSSDAESIYLIKYGYIFEEGIDGNCIMFTGEVNRVYNTPVIYLQPDDAILFCNN